MRRESSWERRVLAPKLRGGLSRRQARGSCSCVPSMSGGFQLPEKAGRVSGRRANSIHISAKRKESEAETRFNDGEDQLPFEGQKFVCDKKVAVCSSIMVGSHVFPAASSEMVTGQKLRHPRTSKKKSVLRAQDLKMAKNRTDPREPSGFWKLRARP